MFNVRFPSDGRMVVWMRLVRGSPDVPINRFNGVVLSALKFIAHDGHFQLPVFLFDEGVAHPVCFKRDRGFHILHRYCFKIIGAIKPCGRVQSRPFGLQQVPNLFFVFFIIFFGSFEHEVFKEVGRAGMAERFVA